MTNIIEAKKSNDDLFFKCAQLYQDKLWLVSLNWRQRNLASRIIFENEDFNSFKKRINQLK